MRGVGGLALLLRRRDKMTRRIVIANQKGGVGKTTTVMNLGAALAEQNQRVLLIDLDAQGGLSASLGVDVYAVRRSVYSLLTYDSISLARVIVPVGETLALAPASIDLAAAEMTLGITNGAAMRLRRALDRSRIPFDFVLIDTPPGLGVLTANGLVAAEELLIPVQCQYLAMRGVRALLETVERIQQRLNPALRLLGILGTMYRPDSIHAQEVIREIRSVFPDKTFRSLIYDSPVFAEAPVAVQSVLQYAPNDPAAQAYRALAQEIAYERRPERTPAPGLVVR
jgi:chromosome partitioning protein